MTDAEAAAARAAAGAHVRLDAGEAVPGPHGLCVREAYVREVRNEAREVDFVCSTDAIDSYGERVLPNWNLTRFEKNPVALFAHNARVLPIGQWKKMRVENGQLVGTLKVASAAANPEAERVWQCLQEGVLRAVSVGFVPHSVRVSKENGVEIVELDDNELMECSVVPIPANPEAVALMKQRALDAYRAKAAPVAPQNHPAPAGAPIEAQRAAEEKTPMSCPKCEEVQKDAATLRETNAKNEAAAKTAESARAAAETDRDAKIKVSAEALALAAAKVVELEGKVLGLQVDADLLPLIGTKLAPAEREGLVEVGKLFLAQGDPGAAKWKAHLDGIKSRGDIAQKTGGSVLDKEPADAAAERSAGDSDDLVADIHARAETVAKAVAKAVVAS